MILSGIIYYKVVLLGGNTYMGITLATDVTIAMEVATEPSPIEFELTYDPTDNVLIIAPLSIYRKHFLKKETI